MNRLFVGTELRKEKVVVVGSPYLGSHPAVKEEFGDGGLPRTRDHLPHSGLEPDSAPSGESS